MAGASPAQLGFLAIFNPSLGATDSTLDDQIVYYASVNTQNAAAQQQQRRRRQSKTSRPTDALSREERHERLRQIGLAQGMVEFSKSFSGDRPVDTIETEKSRVILHELEPGWWILASIDLTKLPLPAAKSTSPPPPGAGKSAESRQPDENFEYSSREVKPAVLLLQDLLRAHSIFLLHHDSSLSSLFVRSQRSKFMSLVGRYWDLFLSTWNVMLHGNPVRNVFGGIKIAACGELGIGVGEEDRGSGEREVLEGFVGRIEGLVDLVVGKFGDDEETGGSGANTKAQGGSEPWLGTSAEPGAEDGAIFLGTGALSRHSLRDITYWMEDVYSWGESAYGVADSPTAIRQHPRRKRATTKTTPPPAETSRPETLPPGIPPPVVKATATPPASAPPKTSAEQNQPEDGPMDKFVSYLKMGYGTHWTLGGSSSEAASDQGSSGKGSEAKPPLSRTGSKDDSAGHYLIGLLGDVEEMSAEDPAQFLHDDTAEAEYNSRTVVRTLTVELDREENPRPESEISRDLGNARPKPTENDTEEERQAATAAPFNRQDRNKTKKLRVVVYVNRPFVFVFLFQLRTDSLAWDGLYRSLHYQLAPLRRSLAVSTAYRPEKPGDAAHIYDLVWDPRSLTVNSTIPNIPDPASSSPSSLSSLSSGTTGAAAAGVPIQQQPQQKRRLPPPWSRAEALSTHTQLLNTFATTRADPAELERTAKTSRGWWIVWSRVLEREEEEEQEPRPGNNNPSDDSLDGRRVSSSSLSAVSSLSAGFGGDDDYEEDDDVSAETPTRGGRDGAAPPTQGFVVSKEIFLIRKAGEHGAGSGARGVSAPFMVAGASPASSLGSGGSWAEGASRLAQGIGVDTKKYIEGLLSLNR